MGLFLAEGGVAGHMNHLYDNPDLTFKKMKQIFLAASSGELKGTEKTDGQNLQLSYDIRTSSARAARNKGNIKDGGLDAAGLAAKFGGRGALEHAFNDAFAAFEEVVGRMSIEEREEIFGPEVNVYYNAEVQDPRAANLINYDLPTLTIHRVGHNEYDRETGKATGRDVSKNARKLAAALERVQGEREEGRFYVQMNAIRKLEALSDDTAAKLAIARLERAISQAGISDNQTVGEYMVSRVEAVVDSRITLADDTKMELMKRIFKEPGANIRNILKLIPKDDAGTIAAVRGLVGEQSALLKQAISPIEEIVHDFSVEMLRGLHSAFILDNEAEVERLRAETSRAIQAIEGSDSDEAMEILAKQMSKLKDVEGVSTAAEGFVFDYDGVTYKFTGNFAPMNQLLGLFKYGRGNVPPLQKLDEDDEAPTDVRRTVAVVPGGFKPPHKGHLAMVEHYAALADLVYVFISPLSRGSARDEAEVTFRQSKDIWRTYLEAKGLSNVTIIDRPSKFNSPVQMAYEFSENENDEPDLAQVGDEILFGASTKPDKRGKPDWVRFKNADKYVRQGAVAADAEANASPTFFEGLSATDFRRALHSGNVMAIGEFLPPEVDPMEIFNILGIEQSPEVPLSEVLLSLVRETIEEMSSMAGGSVEGGSGGNKNKRGLVREKDRFSTAVRRRNAALVRAKNSITPEAINLFHEWIVNEVKDKTVIKYIRAHRIRAYAKGRSEGPYNPSEMPDPKDCKFAIDPKDGRPFMGVGDGPTDLAFYDLWHDAKESIEKIKLKFKYDAFPELRHTENECFQRLRNLDELVKQFLACPYPRDEAEDYKAIKEITDPDDETPYEYCAQTLRAKKHARKEVGQVTKPFERPKEEEEVIEEVLNYLLGKGVVL